MEIRGGRGRGRGSRRSRNPARGVGRILAASRGRGGGRGRGGNTRKGATHVDPSQGWRIRVPSTPAVAMESQFASDVLEERARLFCSSAMSQLRMERVANDTENTRAGHIVLMMDDVLQQCRKWLNGHIALHATNVPSARPVSMGDMYRYVAVLLLSHLTGLSFEKTVALFEQLQCNAPSLDRVRFISTHILAYSSTGRGNMGGEVWTAQRDETVLLDVFENTAYDMSRKVFFTPVHTFATLDDDLYGTRAKDNQVKTLSSRKADREGHAADTVADALFRVTLAVRFRRRGQTQTTNVIKLLDILVESRGEQSLHGLVLTADRGYGSMSLMRILMGRGIGSMLIMPQHLLRCHPFVGQSFFNVTRLDDDEAEIDGDGMEIGTDEAAAEFNTGDAGDAGDAIGVSTGVGQPTHPGQVGSGDREGTDSHVERGDDFPSRATVYDRRRAFVVHDYGGAGPASFYASRSVMPLGGRESRRGTVTAVAIREQGTKKLSNVLRFLHNVPSSISSSMESWIAVPRTASVTRMLFSRRNDAGHLFTPPASSSAEKDIVERHLFQNCSVLTISQRCADWFVMRQFRVTGTNGGDILLRDATVRSLIGLPAQSPESNDMTLPQLLSSFTRTWFSSLRSTEAMMRGTGNESAVLAALSSREFVKAIYECGMLSMGEENWISCSPDGVALIDLAKVGLSAENGPVFASVEIKTSVAMSSLDRAIGRATKDVVTCTVGDQIFRDNIPKEHIGQLILQMMVLKVNFVLYVAASEIGIMYLVVAHCPEEILQECKESLIRGAKHAVAWAHEGDPKVPLFADRDSRISIEEHLPFWRTINGHVKEKGPFPPLKLFKHGSQSLYSKTKGGVDGSAQARSILRCSTSSLQWEQKLVSQTLKSIAVNAFIAWRMAQKKELLISKEAFGSLDSYRDALNHVQPLADFIFDASQELLIYANKLEKSDASAQKDVPEVTGEENARLVALAHRRRGQRLRFFNTPDGVKLRLHVHPHNQRQLPGSKRYCAFCGSTAARRRSTFKCTVCDQHLCIRASPGQRKSCWSIWHEAVKLKPRDESRSPRLAVDEEEEDRSLSVSTPVSHQRKRRRDCEAGPSTVEEEIRPAVSTPVMRRSKRLTSPATGE